MAPQSGRALPFALTRSPIHTIGLGMKRQPAAFKLSKRQLAERDVLADGLREKAAALNAAIAAFNQAIELLSRPVVEALDDYNTILQKARAFAGGVTEAGMTHSMPGPRDGGGATRAFRCEVGSSNGK